MKKIREYTARLEAEKTPMSYATEFSFLLNPDDQENIRRLPHRHGDEFVFRARSMASYMRQEGLVRHESDFDFTEPL